MVYRIAQLPWKLLLNHITERLTAWSRIGM
jgi:hypothetical protein